MRLALWWILLTSNVFTLSGAAQMGVMLVLAYGLSLYFLYLC